MITPAISVLERRRRARGRDARVRSRYVLPITIVILVGLFSVQSRGTARIGAIFGPVMLLWFLVLAVLGLTQIVEHPAVHGRGQSRARGPVLRAKRAGTASSSSAPSSSWSPAARRCTRTWGISARRPIRIAWFVVVLPALLHQLLRSGRAR